MHLITLDHAERVTGNSGRTLPEKLRKRFYRVWSYNRYQLVIPVAAIKRFIKEDIACPDPVSSKHGEYNKG